MIRLSSLAFAAVAALLSACGSNTVELPQKPQVAADRNSLNFGSANGGTTCVGLKNTETVQLFNKGKDDLVITAIALGSSKNQNLFTLTTDPSLQSDQKVTVTSNTSTFARVVYAPTSAGTHTGTLIITSNAENSATLTLQMSATACVCKPKLPECL